MERGNEPTAEQTEGSMRALNAIERFLDDLKTEGRSPHTIAAYGRDLAAFARFSGNPAIDTITPAVMTSFMASDGVQVRACGTKRGKASINRYRVSLKALFAWCEARWLIKRNPTSILRCQRHRGLPPIILTGDEIHTLLSFAFKGKWAERDRGLLMFMLATGCRLGETVALNVRDIDWDTGTVTLHQAKGGDPEVVSVGKTVLAALRALDCGTDAGQPLFRNSRGHRLSTRQVQRIVCRRAVEAGINKPVTPHTLRHTFATRLYNATGDIRLVQVALRHESIATTQTYAQLDRRRLQEVLNATS
jgi:integrase/recombinase XerD